MTAITQDRRQQALPLLLSLLCSMAAMAHEVRRAGENKLRAFFGRRILVFASLKQAAGPRRRNVFFGCVLAFSPETCKFLMFPFCLHVYIIMMNFYAGFSCCGCIFIHVFPLSSSVGKVMWYLQPFSGWKAGWLR